MFEKLKDYIHNEFFCPSFLSLFINPFYFARKSLYKELSVLSRLVNGKVLDIGCGKKPYEKLFECDEYVGLEISIKGKLSKNKADILYDGGNFPVKDASFNWIVCSQVFEHVFNSDIFLSEIARVLKPDGCLLLTAPFIWDEHEQPYDFARYSSFGLKSLIERHGFVILEQRKTLADVRVLFQMINDYIYKITATKNPFLNILICAVLISPFNITAQVVYRLFPQNKDLYLDNVILAKKCRS